MMPRPDRNSQLDNDVGQRPRVPPVPNVSPRIDDFRSMVPTLASNKTTTSHSCEQLDVQNVLRSAASSVNQTRQRASASAERLLRHVEDGVAVKNTETAERTPLHS